jgi:hypothetical protein
LFAHEFFAPFKFPRRAGGAAGAPALRVHHWQQAAQRRY